jgi:hypothetical protein
MSNNAISYIRYRTYDMVYDIQHRTYDIVCRDIRYRMWHTISYVARIQMLICFQIIIRIKYFNTYLTYYVYYVTYFLIFQSKWNKCYNSHNWYNSTYSVTVLQCAFTPFGVHYISRDQPKAHELTNHILHPSPEPSRRSPGAPSKRLRRRCGMVPVSPTGTTGSFPRILSMGMT